MIENYAAVDRLHRFDAAPVHVGTSRGGVLSIPTRLLALLFAVLPFVGCAGSLPKEVESAKLLRISYFDFRTNVNFVLASVNDPQMKDLYSQRKTTANIKVTDDASLQEVVRQLADVDFFEYAGNVDHPDAIADQNPYKFIVVHADGQPFSLFLAKGVAAANPDIGVALSDSATILVNALNSVQQLQWVDADGRGIDFFEKERERLQKENAGKAGGGR